MTSFLRYCQIALTLITMTACGRPASTDTAAVNAADATGTPAPEYFDEISKGLVWCFERQTGSIPDSFDESGACAQFGSIYENHSDNASIKPQLKSFVPAGNDGVGVYEGVVAFTYQNSACEMSIQVDRSDEDVLVRIANSSCHE